MSDERLEAGRHHLHNGRRALQLGFPVEGRSHFEAALLQFRGPELRLGAAHALRGLGDIELSVDRTADAERHVRAAIAEYQALLGLLEDLDDPLAVSEIRTDAHQGEAAAWAVLAELLSRSGRLEQAHAALEAARGRLDGLEESAAGASVFSAFGRLALREGRDADAGRWFERALATHRAIDDHEGQVSSLLVMAEVDRRREQLDAADDTLHEALGLARQLDERALEARVLCALGAVAMQRERVDEARSYYEDALPHARFAGDAEREAIALVGLGEAASASRDPSAMAPLLEGARLLTRIGKLQPLSQAFQRIGLHAVRTETPGLGLVAAEASRQLSLAFDPVHGQGQALRVAVRALAQLGQGRPALVSAMARVAIAGDVQPQADGVARWYKERAPSLAVERLERLSGQELLDEALAGAHAILDPVLAAFGNDARHLRNHEFAMRVIDSLAQGSMVGAGSGVQVAVGPGAVNLLAEDPAENAAPGFEEDVDDEPDTLAGKPPAPRYVGLDDIYGGLYDGEEIG